MKLLYARQLLAEDNFFALVDRPSDPYTRGPLASIPKADVRRTGARLPSISGMGRRPAALPPGCRFHPRCAEAMPVCRAREPALIEVGQGHRARCWLHDTIGATA